jgi:hypothetical protein
VNLLKQTPAPVLPRQFTLPVTSRVQPQAASGWMVWGLRGVAVAATAAFAILLVATLWNQQLPPTTANAPAAQSVPSVVVALAASPEPTAADNVRTSANDVNPTPFMVTEEPSIAAMEAVPVTETPADIQKSQVGQADSANVAPTPQPAPPQPTAEPLAPTEPPEPTVAAAASGASAAAPEAAVATTVPGQPPTPDVFTQRSIIALEGEVILSQLKVREGPGTQYRTIDGLRLGDRVSVVGRSPDNLWLVILYMRNDKPRQGWVSSAYIRLNGKLDSLPEAVLPTPEPPTVTPTPTETPTPELPAATTAAIEPTTEPATATPDAPVTLVAEPTTQPESSPTVAPEVAATETATLDSEPVRGGTPPPAGE